METAIICTHRLQPLHLGHLEFWKEIRQHYSDHLIVCILRRSEFLENVRRGLEDPDTFEEFSRLAFVVEKNPLPNWQRFRLASTAIANEPSLATNTTVLLRNRPDLSWEASIEDLPKKRAWVFNATADSEFSQAKIAYYAEKGEEVRKLNLGRNMGYEGTQIRKQLRSGNLDLSFLPHACKNYFRENCLSYL